MKFLSLFFKIITIIIILLVVPNSGTTNWECFPNAGGRASKGAVFADFRLELLAHWPGFGPGNRLQRFRFDVVSGFRHRMFSLRNRQSMPVLLP